MAQTSVARLAIEGGTPIRSKPWPAWPVWDEGEIEALASVVRSGKWFGPSGTQVNAFAGRWAAYCGARYAAPCTNGTQALEIALRAAGVRVGDEVIIPPYTFIATASSVVQVNAVPVFADIDPDSYNLDPQAAEAAITGRTRAILVVHIGGCPADMDAFRALAERRGLVLLEDAAQAHGARWRGQHVGALGQAGTFSFQASKNLNAGEGGCVVTNDEDCYLAASSLINVGRVPGGQWYQHGLLSGNYRMTEWQAALLLAQLRRLDEQTARRNENALYLARQLAEIPGIAPLKRDERVTCHAYHLFIFRYDASAFRGLPRDEFLRALAAEGIPCSRGYHPLYRSDAFRVDAATHPFAGARDYRSLYLPVVERACDEEACWLTQSMLLAERQDMDDIVAAIRKIQATRSR
ncbi:MAG: DegT/DnrJ/EryC1/StrS family aminotransferase [Armatimonadetes bacterium]|nr:DegT/DnrJ/EryC1/StrS family aminotransferase [Armatimonadota bacterium]